MFLILLQNIMAFNKCSINAKFYGDPLDADGNRLLVGKVRN